MPKLRYLLLGALCVIALALLVGSRDLPIAGVAGAPTPVNDQANVATTVLQTTTTTAPAPAGTASVATSTGTASAKTTGGAVGHTVMKPLVLSTDTITVGGVPINVEIASTSAAVQRGLSGRPSLLPTNGMLFVFNIPAVYKFWMPDMFFPLDMIWINNNKVVDISANVSDVFDPANPIFDTPKTPASYVLEVNAGFAARNGIKIGSAVSL